MDDDQVRAWLLLDVVGLRIPVAVALPVLPGTTIKANSLLLYAHRSCRHTNAVIRKSSS